MIHHTLQQNTHGAVLSCPIGRGTLGSTGGRPSQEWGKSWTADSVNLPDVDPFQVQYIYRVGIYGWRKRCLYLLVLLLMTMVIINLALTIWVLRVMDFTLDGMGKLRISANGLRLDGEAEFLQSLYAGEIRSRKGQPLRLESTQNVTLNARNAQGIITNRLFLGDSVVESMSPKFTIKDPSGEILFEATENEVSVLAETLRINAPGGVRFDGSVQTPRIRAEPFQQLRLESPTRSMRILAPEGVKVESRAGDITATCLRDLKLESKEGVIWLDSEKVELRNLRTALPTNRGRSYQGIYQLCACHSGKLFLAPPDGQCQADDQVCK